MFVVVVALLCMDAIAMPSELDPSFRQGASHTQVPGASQSDSYSEVLVLPDGRLLAYGGVVARFTPTGELDSSFGAGQGFVDPLSHCIVPPQHRCDRGRSMAVQPDGKILIAVNIWFESSGLQEQPWSAAGLIRLDGDGAPDPSFGSQGLAVLPRDLYSDYPQGGIVVEADGGILLIGSSSIDAPRFGTPPPNTKLSFIRFLPNGLPDASFGERGRHVTSLTVDTRSIQSLRQPDGKLLVLYFANRVAPFQPASVARFLTDRRSLDPSFGTAGVTVLDVPPRLSISLFATNPIALQADGAILVAGHSPLAPYLSDFAVVRLRSDGQFDSGFGSGGLATIRPGEAGEYGLGKPGSVGGANRVLVQPDGRIVLAGTVHSDMGEYFPGNIGIASIQHPRIGVARLLPNGAADTTFAGAGVAMFWMQMGSEALGAALDTHGRIVVAGALHSVPLPPATRDPFDLWTYQRTPAVFRLEGGDGPSRGDQREAWAVEYFHAGFGHYFVTAAAKEIAALDTFLFPGAWQRTGRQFKVWTDPGDGLASTCRFFSDQAFAPKSSHFYTSYTDECTTVSASPDWTFEGDAFFVRLPLASGTVSCPAGSVPLYRLYNDGRTGAPNHRYLADATRVAAMVFEGWLVEGDDLTGTYACVAEP